VEILLTQRINAKQPGDEEQLTAIHLLPHIGLDPSQMVGRPEGATEAASQKNQAPIGPSNALHSRLYWLPIGREDWHG